MAEALRDKKPGDKMAIEAHLALKQQTNEGPDLTVEVSVPEGFEINENQENMYWGARRPRGGIGPYAKILEI